MRKAVETAVSLATLYALYKLYNVMQGSAEGIGGTLGNAAAKVSMFLNGSHDIEATRAGVALTSLGLQKHGEALYFMTKERRNAIAAMHPDNAQLITAIFDVNGYVKPRFFSYIDQKPVLLDDITG